MNARFIDTNVLLYAFGSDQRGAIARDVLEAGGAIAVQSLNEFINVSRRKFGADWAYVRDAMTQLRTLCTIIDIHLSAVQEAAVTLAERYLLNIHGAMLVAIALEADCDIFVSEDLHDGLVVNGSLRVSNPFLGVSAG